MSDVVTISISRRALCSLGMALALGSVVASAPAAAAGKMTVLFVCQAGTVKSAIARELFRASAARKGIAVTTISRGLKIEDHVSPGLKTHLAAEGIDTTRDPPRALDQDTLDSADIVVLFDPLPASLSRADARDWTATPSMNDAYEQARSYMDTHIAALLAEIANHSRG